MKKKNWHAQEVGKVRRGGFTERHRHTNWSLAGRPLHECQTGSVYVSRKVVLFDQCLVSVGPSVSQRGNPSKQQSFESNRLYSHLTRQRMSVFVSHSLLLAFRYNVLNKLFRVFALPADTSCEFLASLRLEWTAILTSRGQLSPPSWTGTLQDHQYTICIIVLMLFWVAAFSVHPPASLKCDLQGEGSRKSPPRSSSPRRGHLLQLSVWPVVAIFLFQGNSARRRPSSTRSPKRNAKWRTARRPMGWRAVQVKSF